MVAEGDTGAEGSEEAFTCPTCLGIFVDPCTVVPCGHSVCCHCLSSWLDRGNTRCPSCASTITHASLSFALRAATEAVHGRAVEARRAELKLHQPVTFSFVVAAPYSLGRVLDLLRREVMGNAPNVNFVAGLLGVSFYLFIMLASCYMFIERGWNPLYAVTLLSSFGLASLMNPHLDIMNFILRGRIEDAPPEEPHDAPAPVPVPMPAGRANPAVDELLRYAMALLPGGLVPERWRRPRGAIDERGVGPIAWNGGLRAIAISWLLRFCIFFVVFYWHIQARVDPAATVEEHITEILGGTWTMGSLFRLLLQVFVITFLAVFTLLMSCQLLAQGHAQLGR